MSYDVLCSSGNLFLKSWLTGPTTAWHQLLSYMHSTEIHVISLAVETLGFFCWLTLIRGQRRSTDSWSNLKSSQRPGMAFPKSQKKSKIIWVLFWSRVVSRKFLILLLITKPPLLLFAAGFLFFCVLTSQAIKTKTDIKKFVKWPFCVHSWPLWLPKITWATWPSALTSDQGKSPKKSECFDCDRNHVYLGGVRRGRSWHRFLEAWLWPSANGLLYARYKVGL